MLRPNHLGALCSKRRKGLEKKLKSDNEKPKAISGPMPSLPKPKIENPNISVDVEILSFRQTTLTTLYNVKWNRNENVNKNL